MCAGRRACRVRRVPGVRKVGDVHKVSRRGGMPTEFVHIAEVVRGCRGAHGQRAHGVEGEHDEERAQGR